MTLQLFRIGIVICDIMLICISKTQQCPPKNISCNDVNKAKGFKFLYPCPEGGEISVFDNKTLIAHTARGTQLFRYSNEVISMDNHSLVTRDCRDLRVECIFPNGSFVEEICVDYKMTEKIKNPDPDDSPTRQNLSICVWVGGIVLMMGMFCCCYICKKKQYGAPAVSVFLRYLKTCPCLREGISQAERGESEETRHPGGREVQKVTADDLDTAQSNIVNRLSEISDSYPRGSGENDIKQDDKLGSVQSIDPKADGKTPQSFSLDRNLSNEGLKPDKTRDISAPDKTSDHRAMNRSLKDDPGGVVENKEKYVVWIREKHNGWTPNDRGPEDHGNEGKLLLLNEGAAIQHFDMTGEAVALVNRRGLDPDQVSRCSALDTDVESTPNMKNYT
ncbi:hypothetical protein PFLUV_G00177970 [Perca fluviatilis]|uniref:Uncharacterized protein n=1 Tax=Perca fluviatilis TaxID=8168 RepID=A0A6A5EVE1_PERFL|nr:uncharacterized protein LOC120574525 [Perca fluviatilis]KAF1379624.1 hypothetical protein PFLUV_G00177970 [Perca fluviatilis]